MTDLTNKTLGNFSISHTLGTGGMGTVYKARDTMLDIPVAIKVMHPQFAQQTSLQQRFQQEARSAAAVEHPNIVRVRHFDQQGPHLYMVMEYIPGDNLRDILNALLEKKEWLVLPEALTLVRTVCLAISHAHNSGVIHRDIKPANIMLKPDEESEYGYRPVITDLGLAKMMGAAGITQTDEIMGTPAYMSPEQVLGPNEAIGAASDIYALGVLLYELATSTPPFRATRISEVINYHTQEPATYPDPQTLRPDLPDAIESIMRRALMRQPSERFASANEMGIALDRMLQQRLPHTLPTSVSTVRGLATVHQQSIVAQHGHSLFDQFEHVPPSSESQDSIQIVFPNGGARFMPISSIPITVGREDDNILELRDDPKLSRYHARIEYQNNGLYVIDMSSTNGVYLDDQLIPPNQPTEWRADSILQIGNHHMRIIRAKAVDQLKRDDINSVTAISSIGAVTVPYLGHESYDVAVALESRTTASRHRIGVWGVSALGVVLLTVIGGFIWVSQNRLALPVLSGNGTAVQIEAQTATASIEPALEDQASMTTIDLTVTAAPEAEQSDTQTQRTAITITQSIGPAEEIAATSPTKTAPPSTPKPTPLSNPIAVADGVVNVRGGPDTAHPILGQLANGQPVTVQGHNLDETWWQIEAQVDNEDRKLTGWVSSDYLSLDNEDIVEIAKQIPTKPSPTAILIKSPTPTLSPSPTLPRSGTIKQIGGISFGYVSGGSFLMGNSDPNAVDNERPQTTVTVPAFWIMQTEVTNAQFGEFVGSDGYQNPAYWTTFGWEWKTQNNVTSPEFWFSPNKGGNEHPVIGVSWYEAIAYSRWLSQKLGVSVRLPSEAEWEKAARGIDGRIFPWGNQWDPNHANYCNDTCYQQWKSAGFKHDFTGTGAVRRFESGRSPNNIYDLAGNVLEWTNSLWGGNSESPQYIYPYNSGDGRENVDAPSTVQRVLRGGSWGDSPNSLQVTFRSRNSPEHRDHYIGIRLLVPAL